MKYLYFFLFLSIVVPFTAQEKQINYLDKDYDLKSKHNEIKLNLVFTILDLPEISYERIINENSAVGLSFAWAISNENLDIKYYFLPHYRYFFSKSRAAGFFVEGNFILFEEVTNFFNSSFNFDRETTAYGYGPGIALSLIHI